MSAVFVTGGNGYLGSYACQSLLADTDLDLFLLIRASSRRSALEKLWAGWQLHMDADAFRAALDRVELVYGDLHAPDLGISPAQRETMRERVRSVLHIAASLNRKSDKACLNTNLRGTLSVLKVARDLADHKGLERYTHVSTVAVAGHRSHEVVEEDQAIDWDRSDYDPYGRTKKFCEHMARELLPDVPKAFLRPSTVMGDSRHPMTTQFDMVRAFCLIVDLPVVPLPPEVRLDIVNADWVGRAIASLHTKPRLAHDIYHLSAGRSARSAYEIAAAMSASLHRKPRFAGAVEPLFEATFRAMNRAPRGTAAAGIGALMKVFWPYITFDTVFANERATTELGFGPTPFVDYCGGLYAWSKQHRFTWPPQPLPAGIA